MQDILLKYKTDGFHIALRQDDLKTKSIDQSLWFLSAHRQLPHDKRNKTSTYLNIHKQVKYVESRAWRLVPKNDFKSFMINLYQDDMKYDKIDQGGWYMNVDTNLKSDIRDKNSNYVDLNPYGHDEWKLTPVNGGEDFYITLAKDDKKGSKNMVGWALTAFRKLKSDIRDKDSTYVMIAPKGKANDLWHIDIMHYVKV